MSLTSELNKENSSVSLFFKNNFKIDDFLEENNNHLKGVYTLFPKDLNNYPWSDVGHMVEYLMILHMGLSIKDIFPIKYCVDIFNLERFKLSLISKYSNGIKNYIANKELFSELCLDLYNCSKIESSWRNSKNISTKEIINTTLPSVVLEDIINIYFKSIKKNELINNESNYFYYNPTFELSSAIGGADADLYLKDSSGNFLIDLKTTVKPKIQEGMIFQLLGYVFLDLNNKHNIKDIGVYLTRQNLISRWSVQDIIKNTSVFNDVNEAKEKFIESLSKRNFKLK